MCSRLCSVWFLTPAFPSFLFPFPLGFIFPQPQTIHSILHDPTLLERRDNIQATNPFSLHCSSASGISWPRLFPPHLHLIFLLVIVIFMIEMENTLSPLATLNHS
ncbi:hypothetical protein B0T20DRAFT_194178 [Sordaria brevicollis]|uniref:Uncharacterized protein n=1 Tax=Sordaria brevicollis TaxID=83679 RepID=A0AAE0UCK9_SORBR|nr:hypothetical protein B0T20DRAFT_194178 [Sordaria brevicollis]